MEIPQDSVCGRRTTSVVGASVHFRQSLLGPSATLPASPYPTAYYPRGGGCLRTSGWGPNPDAAPPTEVAGPRPSAPRPLGAPLALVPARRSGCFIMANERTT